MRFIGIDPGITGALACLTDDGRVVETARMPAIQTGKSKRQVEPRAVAAFVRTHLTQAGSVFVTIEQVHAFPGQGVSSMFSFGRSFGMVEAVVAVLGLPYTLVAPQRWQKALLGPQATEMGPKHRTKLAVYRLWPDHVDTGEGIRDALLIAEYGRRLKASPALLREATA